MRVLTITDKQRRKVALSLEASLPQFVRPRKQVVDMAPDEVRSYLRRVNRFMFACLAAVAAWNAWDAFQPESMKPPAPVAHEQDAGAVKSITVHHTAFSSNTTVTTDTGVYQVVGSVSAAVGDRATVQSTEPRSRPSHAPKLCIDSAIKAACYRIE